MRRLTPALLALAAAFACQKGDPKVEPEEDSSEASNAAATGEEEPPSPGANELGVELPPAPDDVSAPPEDGQKTDSGVVYKVLEPGPDGAGVVGRNDLVTMHYDSWTADGAPVDSTRRRKRPMILLLGTVPMRGFADGVTGMKVGEKRRMWVPAKKAFRQSADARSKMIVYDVEVLEATHAAAIPDSVEGPPDGAKKSKAGVFYEILTPGKGRPPRPWDRVKLHLRAWTADGRMFYSTRLRPGEPALTRADKNLAGVTDALVHMRPGEKRRAWIPEELAFKGVPNKPAGMVVYDLELLDVTRMPDPPPVPRDVSGPPKGAKKTELGVFYRVLKEGAGKELPKPTSRVKIHYTGWTTDGERFDTSITRDQPLTFKLDGGVMPGWRDGVRTMVVGEKKRFWIPKELAYDGKPNRPEGMLVFDIELLEIL